MYYILIEVTREHYSDGLQNIFMIYSIRIVWQLKMIVSLCSVSIWSINVYICYIFISGETTTTTTAAATAATTATTKILAGMLFYSSVCRRWVVVVFGVGFVSFFVVVFLLGFFLLGFFERLCVYLWVFSYFISSFLSFISSCDFIAP